MEKARADISNLDAQIEKGELAPLLGWLRKNLHQHGRKFTPNELLERTTGRPLTAEPWITYVRQKFGALYGLESAPTRR
jgi:carboxypeptidase Taq